MRVATIGELTVAGSKPSFWRARGSMAPSSTAQRTMPRMARPTDTATRTGCGVDATPTQYQNITRAAASLALSQSAASSALKDLESQFEIQLFDRIGKRLQINELGRLLRPQAQALVDRAIDLEAGLDRHGEAGSIKIGATLTIGNYLAVELIARYMKRYGGSASLAQSVTSEAVIRRYFPDSRSIQDWAPVLVRV